jgi:hypothetical protein
MLHVPNALAPRKELASPNGEGVRWASVVSALWGRAISLFETEIDIRVSESKAVTSMDELSRITEIIYTLYIIS